jgi:hypothetical protein
MPLLSTSSSSQSTVILLTTLAIVSAVTIFSTAHLVRRRRHSSYQGGKEQDDALRDLLLDEEEREEENEEEPTRPVHNAVNRMEEEKKNQISPLPPTAAATSSSSTLPTSTPVLSPVLPHEVRRTSAATAHTADVLLNKDIRTGKRHISRRSLTSSTKEQDSARPTRSKKLVTKVSSSKGVTARSKNNSTKEDLAQARERRESHHRDEEEDSSGATRTTANEEDEDTTEDSIMTGSRDEGTASDLSVSGDDDESYFLNNASPRQPQQAETTCTSTTTNTNSNIRVAQLPIELELLYQNDRRYIERAKYSGPLVNGQPHGMGVLWFENGSMYVGEFHKSEMHGVGAFNYKRTGKHHRSSHHVYRGEFVHNEFVPSSSSEPTVPPTTEEKEPQLSPSSSSSVDQDGPVHRVRVRETLKHTIEAYLCVTQAKKEQRRSGKGGRYEIRR